MSSSSRALDSTSSRGPSRRRVTMTPSTTSRNGRSRDDDDDPLSTLSNTNNNNNNNNNNTRSNSTNLRASLQPVPSFFKMVAITKEDVQYCESTVTGVGQEESKWIFWLKAVIWIATVCTAVIVATGVFVYTRNDQMHAFRTHYDASAHQILRALAQTVERTLSATAELSTTITSYAVATNQTFPTVTLPDFELRASYARVQSGSHVIRWLPLVTDETRDDWEAYAQQHRQHISTAFRRDQAYRRQQDAGWQANDDEDDDTKDDKRHRLTSTTATSTTKNNNNNNHTRTEDFAVVHQDGLNYHPQIWSDGSAFPRGVVPRGLGHYLPDWQRSPVTDEQQGFLNRDWIRSGALPTDTMEVIQRERKAILQKVVQPSPSVFPQLRETLRVSQYRQNLNDYLDGLMSFFVYPVFESLVHNDNDDNNDDDNTDNRPPVVGILTTSVYWKVLFSNLLPSSSVGIICVVENGLNQTFSYQIDGAQATLLGMGDWHDRAYENEAVSIHINEYLDQRANPQNTAYRTAPLSDWSQYKIRVYPSRTTKDQFVTHQPTVYMFVVVGGFLLAAALFVLFSRVVEQRQRLMYQKVIENAEKAAAAERELNEFLSHEVRNPLAAAIAACTFVSTALHEKENLDPETKKNAREDMEVVQSSLHFINDFLRSMLDLHRATINQLKLRPQAVDLKTDVIDPVLAIVYKRLANFEVVSECPEDLIITTDPIRLKQVILNLVRNATKFVQHGFVKIRATVTEESVMVYVEDSGPGIPLEKRSNLFKKYQQSLDVLNQGTGLGLSLSKSLVENMGGEIWLDDTYHSGVADDCPGTRFVIQLNLHPEETDMFAEEDKSHLLQIAADRIKNRASMTLLSHAELDYMFSTPLSPEDDSSTGSSSSTPRNDEEEDSGKTTALPEGQPNTGCNNKSGNQRQTSMSALSRQRGSMRASLSRRGASMRASLLAKNQPVPILLSDVESQIEQQQQLQPPVSDVENQRQQQQQVAGEDHQETASSLSSPPSLFQALSLLPPTDDAFTMPQSQKLPQGDNNDPVTSQEEEMIEFDSTIRVLFVDDDAMLRKLFVRAVRKARPEWEIKEASSGEMALQMCESETFDLIFLDQYMASTEKQLLGTETAQAMRSKGNLAIICGLSANDVRAGFLKAGADDFMMKPFPCRGEALDSTLRNLLTTGSAAGAVS